MGTNTKRQAIIEETKGAFDKLNCSVKKIDLVGITPKSKLSVLKRKVQDLDAALDDFKKLNNCLEKLNSTNEH